MSHSRQRARSPLALFLLTCMAAAAVPSVRAADDFSSTEAQTPSPITDHFAFRASFFHASVSTDLRLDPSGQPLAGTPLSGAADLGFSPSENDGTVELMFRLRERNRILAEYLELDQSGTTTLTRPIVFGDEVFRTGDVVTSNLQWRVMGVTWTYAIIQNDRFELGAGLGVHLMDLDVRGNVPARFADHERSISGALPTPALETAWRISSRFSVTARAQYIHASINETTGSFTDVHADVQYRWAPNFAIGVGYSLERMKLDSQVQSAPGLIGIRLKGPELFVRASF